MMNTTSVREEEAVSLLGRALARRFFPELGLVDPVAEKLAARLALDAGQFDLRRLRAATMRARVIDDLARTFFQREPAGLGISLFPGLCTRFSRVDNGALSWVELQHPDLADQKRELLPACDRHSIAPCCSAACQGWMSVLRDAGHAPTLLIAEGGPLPFSNERRDAFLMQAVQHLPSGTELVIEYDAYAPIRPSSLGSERPSLEAVDASGAWVRYPRIRFVRPHEYSPQLEHDLSGLNAVSRLFRGRALPSVAHLRFA